MQDNHQHLPSESQEEQFVQIDQSEEFELEIKENVKNSKKGHLKIFLGYCAGVGKTYRMLQEANTLKNNNIDVVIGIAETHGRRETENLVKDLETVQRKQLDYGGIAVTEMDLDAIILRKPRLVLVDELAHTNMPNSRHAKRYQDVEELLNTGIDVYTTLNIQHVQSVIDIIQQITNIKVEEIIPDRILEIASEIELIDLPIEKLQQRLAEGKVYIPQKAKQAMEKFFKKGNLLALRELSLKYTAKRVDSDLLSYREKEEISNVWPVESKLLVSLSSGKTSEKLLLITHRMAKDLSAEWYAVNVESPQQVHLSDKSRAQLNKNIHLAEELGAKVVTLSGNVIADEVVKFAKQKNVTLIIAGLSSRSRWDELFRGSILNRLVKKSSPINVLVIGNEYSPKKSSATQTYNKTNYKPYLLSSAIIILTALLCTMLGNLVTPLDVLMFLFLPVMIVGILWGVNVNLFASLLSIAATDFFFIPPKFSFAITDVKYISSFVVFLLVAVTLNILGRFIRWRTSNARQRERFITALYNFSHEIMLAETLDDIITRVVKNISEAFEADVIILLPDKFDQLEFITKNKANLSLKETEKAVALWVYKNGLPAGKGTSTLSSTKWYYLPLILNDNVLGVICMLNSATDLGFSQEQKRLLESFASVVALALTKLGHK